MMMIMMMIMMFILTFVTRDQAERFAEAPFIKSEVIGFKNKIKKMKLEVFRSE